MTLSNVREIVIYVKVTLVYNKKTIFTPVYLPTLRVQKVFSCLSVTLHIMVIVHFLLREPRII